jgi:glycerate kinase
LGAVFAGFLHARLESGIQLVLDIIGVEQKRGVDYVITGEGKLDEQTSMGKAPLGVTQLIFHPKDQQTPYFHWK